eukprot:764722-Hanusia_phi.AAC.3
MSSSSGSFFALPNLLSRSRDGPCNLAIIVGKACRHYATAAEKEIQGLPVLRPVHMEFPVGGKNIDNGQEEKSSTFMLGPSLLIVPTSNMEDQPMSVRLPPSRWYNLDSGSEVTGAGAGAGAGAGLVLLSAPLGSLPMLLRGGAVLPVQIPAANIPDQSSSSFIFVCAPDESGRASGDLYLDDGKSPKNVVNGRFMSMRSNCFVDAKNQIGNFTLQSIKKDRSFQVGTRANLRKVNNTEWPIDISKDNVRLDDKKNTLHIDLSLPSHQAEAKKQEVDDEQLVKEKRREQQKVVSSPWPWMEGREGRGAEGGGSRGEEEETFSLDISRDLHVNWRVRRE